jgi:formylglycine-generating enzyme required for sulfatase activity
MGGIALLLAPAVPGTAGFLGLLALAFWLVFSGAPVPFEFAVPTPSLARPEPPEVQPVEVEDPLWASIPAGRFRMGSNEYDSEKPIHEVTISAFHCLRTPVTRQLYQHIMGQEPGWPEGEADLRPVNQVSWFDAVKFCNRWSEVLGLSPCYQIDGNTVSCDFQADGVRLLTEAEWEYACRAGSSAKWCFGDDETELPDYAWFTKNSDNQPHPVGEKRANDFGLFDMHGNVWEWCWDWYAAYAAKGQTDPVGPAAGNGRVLRGGAFNVEPRYLRSADRVRDDPVNRYQDIGFRCARGPRR